MTAPRRSLRWRPSCEGGALLLVVAALLVLASVLASSSEKRALSVDEEIFQRQMTERFGPQRLPVAAAWALMLSSLADQDESQKLQTVNRFFHRHVTYTEDRDLWGQEDYWATPLETLGKGRGDCEDYVIGKYISLLHGGIEEKKLRLIYVRAQLGGGRSRAHMVLGYYPEPGAEPLILDSLISTILPASQRTDLVPVFSFNSEGLWAGQSGDSAGQPRERLSRWRNVLDRLQREGVKWQ